MQSSKTKLNYCKKAKSLQEGLLRQIDEDTEAFNQVSAVFGLPKQPKKKSPPRSNAGCFKRSSCYTFSVMEKIVDALKVTQAAVGKSNTNAASDLGSCFEFKGSYKVRG